MRKKCVKITQKLRTEKELYLCLSINRSMRVCVIVATHLGFKKAFEGIGINCALIEDFYEELYSRGCTFTEIKCPYMGEAIKTFLRNANHIQS